jgi:hypothetical protein
MRRGPKCWSYKAGMDPGKTRSASTSATPAKRHSLTPSDIPSSHKASRRNNRRFCFGLAEASGPRGWLVQEWVRMSAPGRELPKCLTDAVSALTCCVPKACHSAAGHSWALVRGGRICGGRISSTGRQRPSRAGVACDGPVPVRQTATTTCAIAEQQRSRLRNMDCEHRLNIPHSAVIPPSTNSRAPVT